MLEEIIRIVQERICLREKKLFEKKKSRAQIFTYKLIKPRIPAAVQHVKDLALPQL